MAAKRLEREGFYVKEQLAVYAKYVALPTKSMSARTMAAKRLEREL